MLRQVPLLLEPHLHQHCPLSDGGEGAAVRVGLLSDCSASSARRSADPLRHAPSFLRLDTCLASPPFATMAPNAHANILTDSIRPEELEVANLFDVNGRVAIGEFRREAAYYSLTS